MTPPLTPSEREIFPYWNGSARVWGDPVRIDRLLHAHLGGSLKDVLETARSKEAVQNEPQAWAGSVGRLVEAVREAFEMPPFDPVTGQGATEKECKDALVAFLVWLQKKSPNTASPPTSPPSGASPS